MACTANKLCVRTQMPVKSLSLTEPWMNPALSEFVAHCQSRTAFDALSHCEAHVRLSDLHVLNGLWQLFT